MSSIFRCDLVNRCRKFVGEPFEGGERVVVVDCGCVFGEAFEVSRSDDETDILYLFF